MARLGVPFLITLHGRLDWPGLPDLGHRFPDAPFVSISRNQRAPLPRARWLDTIYHGLPRQFVAAFLCARTLPRISRQAFSGQRPRGGDPDRARRRQAVTHRRKTAAFA